MKRPTWRHLIAGALAAAIVAWLPQVAMAQPKATEAAPAAQKAEAEKAAPTAAPRGFLELDPEFCKRLDEFITKTKQPCDFLTWGADLRLRTIWSNNITTLNKTVPNHTRHFQRYRSRAWAKLSPTEDIDFNVRFVWEPRVIQKGPNDAYVPHKRRWVWDEVIFDQFNVTLRNIADLPLSAVLGRQDIIYGNGWLVLDGTPLDGSRTIFFDAVKLSWDAKDINTVFDAIYIDQDDDNDRYLKPFNQTGQPVMEQDERGFIFYVTNKSIEATQLEGFYIYKHDTPRWARGSDAELHTVGARVVSAVADNVNYRAEGAYQWGKQAIGAAPTQSHRAFGFNSRVTYLCKDELNNQFHADYEFLSGDDPDSAAIEAFDPLWGRWPQWSELFVYTCALERGRPGEITNLHRLGVGWDCKPASNLTFRTNYHLLWSDENTQAANVRFSNNGSFRGQLLESRLTYRFCKNITGHVLGEFFFPGNFYTRVTNEPAVFLRYELVFTW